MPSEFRYTINDWGYVITLLILGSYGRVLDFHITIQRIISVIVYVATSCCAGVGVELYIFH